MAYGEINNRFMVVSDEQVPISSSEYLRTADVHAFSLFLICNESFIASTDLLIVQFFPIMDSVAH